MGLGPWMTCFWPGLPRLWWRGQWWGFVAAALFALGLNAALAATCLWPHLVGGVGLAAAWSVLSVVWLVCLRRGAARLTQFYCGEGQRNDELFSRAQEEYLQGRWFEAESLLLRLVRDDPADVEGRLLLATLYRHTQRPDLARTQLDQMERFPHAGRWGWEVLQERNRLTQLCPEPAPDASADAESPASVDEAGETEQSVSASQANLAGNSEPPTVGEKKTAATEHSLARGGLSKAA